MKGDEIRYTFPQLVKDFMCSSHRVYLYAQPGATRLRRMDVHFAHAGPQTWQGLYEGGLKSFYTVQQRVALP